MPTLVCDNYRVEHMEKHNRHIDELITKYLDKSLTREECAELRRYLAEDKKHLAYFAEIRDLWLYNTALWQPVISTRSALEKLKKRIREYTSLVKSLYLSYRKGIQRLFRHNPYGSHLDP